MGSQAAQQIAIRQYLLGRLSQTEQGELEERLLADGVFYEELLIEEEELVDQYLRGELSVPESEYFETHFLQTPERQQKLSFAAALNKYITIEVVSNPDEQVHAEVPEPTVGWRVFSLLHIQSPVVGFALAATVLVILFGSSWMIVRNWLQPGPQDILTEVLIPGQTRSGDPGEVKKFAIPSDKDTVRLQLELLANDYQVYRAVLQDAAGTVLMTKDLKTQSVSGRAAVVIDVPVGKLPPSSYQIKLKGITAKGQEENIGSYPFRVSK